MSIISLRCQHCDGIMEFEDGNRIAFCPYCGTKILFDESDDVKRQKIVSGSYVDVETKRADVDYEKVYVRETEETKRQNANHRSTIVIFVIWGIILLAALIFLYLSGELSR